MLLYKSLNFYLQAQCLTRVTCVVLLGWVISACHSDVTWSLSPTLHWGELHTGHQHMQLMSTWTLDALSLQSYSEHCDCDWKHAHPVSMSTNKPRYPNLPPFKCVHIEAKNTNLLCSAFHSVQRSTCHQIPDTRYQIPDTRGQKMLKRDIDIVLHFDISTQYIHSQSTFIICKV